MSSLVECIPNFSEARRPEVVEAILAAIAAAGVSVLDRHSDSDHNRTVITFVGTPAAVEEAAFQGIRKAAELIDLNVHTGSHPRIGATDVVPFVPLSDISMEDCIAMARRLGERVGRELAIPVYLYEEAATRPERTNLENSRHGQYEGLKREIGTHPEREPDFGPAHLGTAGATVIGARHPLVAYNVFLSTNDLNVAKDIARGVRHSSGGYHYVKALGMLVDGMAQVSMNLTNFRQTPVFRVVETIRREAARYGVSIHHSELVGLIPQDALIDSAVWYLQLDGFKPDQILEQRLYAAAADSGAGAGDSFLYGLASATPTPGGGSAAAHAGAMGAALVAMVARLTIGKKKYAAVEDQMNEILNQAERLRRELTAAVQEDAAAFEAVMAAFKLPADTPAEQMNRAEVIEKATLAAAQMPLTVAQKSFTVIALAERVVALGNLNAISDGASAAAMAHAALTSAGYNVRINVNSLANQSAGLALLSQLHTLEGKATRLERLVHKSIQERGGTAPGVRPITPTFFLVMILLAACGGQALGNENTATETSPMQTVHRTSTPLVPSFAPSPLPTVSITPSPCDPSTEDYCIEQAFFIFQPPIAPPGINTIDRGYPYGSTEQGTRDPHHGVEFYNPSGTPVLAAAGGTVYYAGEDVSRKFSPWTGFYGNIVVLEHSLTSGPFAKLYTLYAHLSKINVISGQTVSPREKIGEVGLSGTASGSHLHFEVRVDPNDYDSTLNPELWLVPHQGNGSLALLATDPAGASLYPTFNVQYYPDRQQPAVAAYQVDGYALEKSNPLDPWAEIAALGDQPAGWYRLTFLWAGTLYERWVEIQPGKLTRVHFVVK